jgi:hypothetical protein
MESAGTSATGIRVGPGEEIKKAQTLFFWDDAKADCGVLLFLPGATVRYSRISDLIDNLTAKSAIRERYKRVLAFPLEDHYSEFGAFPEEAATIQTQV